LPPEHQRIAQRDGVKRAVADYVAGMTDRYALDTYASIFIPSGWGHL
jgi:dGTPase